MKVVLFCGGLGTRLREHADTMPKPLVNVGYRPIVWHLMRYYAHFGHTDFILCLGYQGHTIREYFLNYSEAMSNDFTLSEGGRKVTLHSSDTDNWRITFADTGLHSNIAERLLAVKRYLDDEPVFLANYSDGLADLPLDLMVDNFLSTDAVASFAAVKPLQSFHVVRVGSDSRVTDLGEVQDGEFLINGGYFVLRKEIFDYIREGEELVEEPFHRLISEGKLLGHKHKGFWRSMDTLKDKISFDRMYFGGEAPWEVWRGD